jgi:acetyl/propionyl-CoA carboxylase alpha subunit
MTISRVFVANRGEIALRIVRACRRLGIESVLCVSEVDREGPAARLADRVVCIGPAPAKQSYLRRDTIVAAALGTRCDAIHPGYGFLAENPELAVECRLTAEDVSNGYRPSPGTIIRFDVPDMPSLRVDRHCERGTVIPPHYDSLIASMLAHDDFARGAITTRWLEEAAVA